MSTPQEKSAATRRKNLSTRQHEAISTILASASVPIAAKELEIAPRTLYRWLQDEEFEAAVMEARRQRMQQASNRLQDLAARAITTLEALLGEDNPPSVRVQALKLAINFAYKAYELDDIVERVEELEASGEPGSSWV